MNATIISHVTQVMDRLDKCIYSAMEEMKDESILWVQWQMLSGYDTPHGEDMHTEIYMSGYMSEESLHAEAKKDSQNTYTLSVGSDAPYAPYVHNGTCKLEGRPFISDALYNNQDKQEKIYLKHLKAMSEK